MKSKYCFSLLIFILGFIDCSTFKSTSNSAVKKLKNNTILNSFSLTASFADSIISRDSSIYLKITLKNIGRDTVWIRNKVINRIDDLLPDYSIKLAKAPDSSNVIGLYTNSPAKSNESDYFKLPPQEYIDYVLLMNLWLESTFPKDILRQIQRMNSHVVPGKYSLFLRYYPIISMNGVSGSNSEYYVKSNLAPIIIE